MIIFWFLLMKMTIELPEKYKKYVVLDEKQEKINRFECPICDFDTKQGPGALRMHLLLKSDPKIENRYDEEHEKASKNEEIYKLSTVRELSKYPHETVNPEEN